MNRSEKSEVWKSWVSLGVPLDLSALLGEMEMDPLLQGVIRIA